MSIGNLKTDGGKGTNWPWQYKMLQGLQSIYDEVKKPLTCVEDSIKICDGLGNSLNINANGSLDVNVLSSLPLSVEIDQANDSILIYGYDSGGMSNVAVSVDANGFVNTNANVVFPASLDTTIIGPLGSATICDDAVAVTFCADLNTEFLDQGTALDAIQTAVEGTLDVNVTNTVTVTATDLDIRDLTFATDSVDVSGSNVNATVSGTVAVSGISDGTDSLEINPDGSINVNATIECTTSSIKICDADADILNINPDGSINITDNGGSITVDGTVTANQGTSPWVVSGTVTATPTGTQDVNIVSTVAIPVTDNGGSLTVDGAVTATITGITGPLGERACEEGLSVTLCEDQRSLLTNISTNTTAIVRTPRIIRYSANGLQTIAPAIYDFSVANVGAANGQVLGTDIKPGETLTFSAGGINNTYAAGSITYDALGVTELIITYNE
jgi:hypothetical protein